MEDGTKALLLLLLVWSMAVVAVLVRLFEEEGWGWASGSEGGGVSKTALEREKQPRKRMMVRKWRRSPFDGGGREAGEWIGWGGTEKVAEGRVAARPWWTDS